MKDRKRKTQGRVGYYNGAIIALNRLEEEIRGFAAVLVNKQAFVSHDEVLGSISDLRTYYEYQARGNNAFWDKVKAKNKEDER